MSQTGLGAFPFMLAPATGGISEHRRAITPAIIPLEQILFRLHGHLFNPRGAHHRRCGREFHAVVGKYRRCSRMEAERQKNTCCEEPETLTRPICVTIALGCCLFFSLFIATTEYGAFGEFFSSKTNGH